MGRFNNEALEVQDLRIDMMVNILIHGLKKGSLASALARDLPTDVEQLMAMAQIYINEEEMNAMKDGEWRSKGRDRNRDFEKGGEASSRGLIREGSTHINLDESFDDGGEVRCAQVAPTHQKKDGNEARSRSWSRKKFVSRGREEKVEDRENALVKGIIHTIAGGPIGGDSKCARKRYEREDRAGRGTNFTVHKVLVDNGSFADIIFKDVLRKMGLDGAKLDPVRIPLVGFSGSELTSSGTIELPVSIGTKPKRKTMMVKFLVVDTPFTYNVILGWPGLNLFKAIVFTYHLKMKFPTKNEWARLLVIERRPGDAITCH
ncbi:UNVERIFIED_CONTAM: hypothetical protein Sindi_1259000 [Sesamum indicum]